MSTNCQYVVQGDKLVITVDLTQNHGESNSGKTDIVATSAGPIKLDGKYLGVAFGLNVYRKRKAAPAAKVA